MKKFLLLAVMAVTAGAQAQVTPKVQPETPVNGKSYILVNKAQTAGQYMSRTSWDGAFYFLGESDSNWANHAFTAFDNGDGTWSFGIPSTEEEGFYDYLAIPDGSPNLNAHATEAVMWKLDPKENGFYNLILGEGNNYDAIAKADMTMTKDVRLHLNNGSQYFVTTYYGGPWYPDCVGGVTEIDDESTGDLFFQANDSTSFCWGFVSPENVPAYYLDLQSSATINKFHHDYCSIEDYADGFLKTYQAAADIYNSAEYSEDDIEIINAMINGKVNLYKEIEQANNINETDDAALSAAIEKAKTAFGSAVNAAEVESALKALKDAESAYQKGTGDVTSLGQNMSFEDLSAQGGSESSSVAGAPAGWNVYINGKQAITAGDVSASGVSAWHGVNSDSEGEIKDGAQSFGIWNGSIPTYELSQTIENLENGTYEITAGLMAGNNGNGSRLTTQRIFGNLNSTYYASESDYNLDVLDKSEVYAFAENEILTTDREMRPVTVNAFVYDGTLTFGVRTDSNIAAANRESGNGAGGDGWFKTDNFKIVYKGYVAEDAINIFDFYATQIAELDGEKMAAATQEKLDNANLGDVTESTPQDEIIKAILTAKDLIGEVESSVKNYKKLGDAIEQHYNNLDQYSQKAGAGDYSDVIGEVDEAYMDGTLNTEEEINAAIERLNNALQDCIQSDDIEEGADLTEYIKNPSFEDLSAQGGNNSDGVANPPAGWNIYVEGNKCETSAELNQNGLGNWCAINAGDNLDITNTQGETVNHQYTDGEHVWGIWSGAMPVVELSQTIKGLPAGTYTLTADIVVQNDWAGYNLTSQRLFANDYVTLFGGQDDYIQNFDEELHASFPEDVLAAEEIDKQTPDAEVKHLNYAGNYVNENYGASGAPYTTTVVFGLAKAGDVTFGFRTNRVSAVTGQIEGQASLGWFKIDNFHLTYDSAEVPAGAEVTEIKDVTNNANCAAQFYSVNGARLSAPQKGINIVKMANGTVSKVLVK